jgi:hypothetical protein
MALPICELISQNILDTLKGISVAAGFNVNLDARRATHPAAPAAPGLAILYEGDDDPQDGGAVGRQTWHRPYGVLIWGAGTTSDQTPYDQLLNTARADVEKAIMAKVSHGGYAFNTVLNKPLKSESDNEPPSIMVMFTVHYRTRLDDPFTQG